MKRSVLTNAAVIIGLAGTATPAMAWDWGDLGLALLTSAAAVGAGIAGTPVAGFAVGGAAFTAEIGGSMMRGYTSAAPPAPNTNAAAYSSRSNTPAIVANFAPDPGASALLNARSQAVLSQVSLSVADARNAYETRARLAGAITAGSAVDAVNQQQWLGEFEASLESNVRALGPLLQDYRSALAAEFPTYAGITVSPMQAFAMAQQEAMGNFPLIEQQAIAQWGLTPSEVGIAQGFFASLSAQDFLEAGGASMDAALGHASTGFSSYTVPAPAAGMLAAAGLACMGLRRRR